MSSLFFRRSAASKAEYAESARAAVVAAQAEAASLHHPATYGEHFLLGALAVEGPGRLLVESFGLALEEARAWVAAARPAGKVPRGGPPFNPSTRAVLDRAAEAAQALGHAEVTSAHIVVGVAGAAGLGAELLREHGIDTASLQRALMDVAPADASDSLSQVRKEPGPASDSLLRAEPEAPVSVPAQHRAEHFVLNLTGSADDWTAQLDRAAGDGWRLVAVVPLGAEVRAVFRRG